MHLKQESYLKLLKKLNSNSNHKKKVFMKFMMKMNLLLFGILELKIKINKLRVIILFQIHRNTAILIHFQIPRSKAAIMLQQLTYQMNKSSTYHHNHNNHNHYNNNNIQK